MEPPSDENITMLLSMGFSDIEYIRKALQLAKNDLNEAVAILTGEVNRGGFGSPNDIEMKEATQASGDVVQCQNNNAKMVPVSSVFGPEQEDVKSEEAIDVADEEGLESIEMSIEDMPEEFPVTNLYELEDRLFTDNWSIPYKKHESLAKCLYSTIKLTSLMKAEKDEHCNRFLDRVLPECFQKLLFSQAVKKWTGDIHEGVYNMIKLFVDLSTVRLKYEPVPLKILASLSQCLDPESEFHFKNRSHKWDRAHNEDLFGYDKCPAVSPPYNTYKEPFGWLVDLINRFAFKGGFDSIVDIIEQTDKLTPTLLAALLKPFGLCAAYLNADVVGCKLGPTADKVVHYIKDLQPSDMKEKEVDKVYDLLRTLHCICESVWPDKTSAIDELHLNTILKMLNLPHFNARMNALKELCKLIKEAEKDRWNTNAQYDAILKWLVENKVLSIAFSSSVHHSQYCEKLKKVVEFSGIKISNEELTNIWNMQSGKHVTVVDNIHTIISSAAPKFSTNQMDHLIFLIEASWKDEDQKSKERLLLLMGRIGQEIRDGEIVIKLLNLLWDVSHIEELPMYLVNQAVQSHLDILTESNTTRGNVKTEYVVKCVQDIRKQHWVVPAIRHMLNNLKSLTTQPNSKNSRAAIQDLQNQHNLLKLLCQSLIDCHKGITQSIPEGTLSGETIINGMYSYAETIITHLKLIEFLLQDGGLYLGWSRCKEIWDCLMLDGQNCDGDYETCLEWFVNCINDLQPETQKDLFSSKILKTDVSKMRDIGYKCFKTYFESVNTHEHRIRRNGPSIVVEKQDLSGLAYLWQLVLETPYANIAEEATQYLINVSYSRLSLKLKKTEHVATHKRFINECYKKLEILLSNFRECNNATGPKEGKISKTFKKPLPVKDYSMERSNVLLSIERLLNLACLYIGTVEDNYTNPRSFAPHGSCFHGYPIQININCESNKSEFKISCHSNESMLSMRTKIAEKLSSNVEHVQIYLQDKLLLPTKDQKLLSQLDFVEKQDLMVKIVTIGAINGGVSTNNNDDDISPPVNKPSALLEREKALPSFLMAVEYKIFDKLYELAEMEEPKITNALKNLFLHLPTDADVLQAIDVFSLQNPLLCSPGTRAGYATTSLSVLENYFKCSAPKMSTFRVLYNLQVLSSKLMPVIGNEPVTTADSFKENWLNAGGLSLIMNILLPDTLPIHADYELRQNCYYIILQLARFLLCGDSYETSLIITPQPPLQTFAQATAGLYVTPNNNSSALNVTMQSDCGAGDGPITYSTPIKTPVTPVTPRGLAKPHSLNASSWPGVKTNQSGSPVSTTQLSSSPGSAASFTPENGSLRKRLRSSSVLDTVSPTVKMVIENLNEEEFCETIASLVQLAWSAAAGQLQLNTRMQKKTETRSSSREELKAGICLQQENVSHMDSVLANNSLELLVMCLQLRPTFLNTFYNIPHVSEFIIDVLTGSPSAKVRESAYQQFSVLGTMTFIDAKAIQPKKFFLDILIKTHLPVWTVSGNVRGLFCKVLVQCQEFFNLLCQVMYMLTSAEQAEYEIEPVKLLEEELTFVMNSDSVNAELLLSHLKLVNVLFTCEGVDKKSIGYNFIQFLLNDFLFLTSRTKVTNMNASLSNFNLLDLNINSFDGNCRKEAFNLLLTLADRCPDNLCEIASQLVSIHHEQMKSQEWDFHPPVSSRPINGFVGLQNAGATCYMNSVLQQIYMQPGLRELVLKTDNDKSKQSSSILFQIQNIFGHLLESQAQYYGPENFWKSFKLWGEPVNPREQQDAFEFFINITDQLDENLKSLGREEIFKKTFCGMFVDQKICNECSHSFERDEPFFSLPVTVNCGQLEASLDQFVHSEVMEGDNAYYCEKCCERRTTMKRTCIKTLPPVLVIQLKRFWYDWERNRAIKFDDFFSFPWIMDMEPFTRDGISRKEKDEGGRNSSSEAPETKNVKISTTIDDYQNSYELVGIVVHSGQASAGHYYSYIKNRQTTIGELNKWYKFNDICVETVDLTDELLKTECFGGEYRVPQTDSNNQYPENRIRNWNAYMLFYETMDKSRLPPCSSSAFPDPRGQILGDIMRSYPGSPASSSSSNPPSPGSRDSLSQLSALIRKGDRKGLFNDNMPATIKQMVNEDNVEFMQNRDVYNEDYFEFVRHLCSSNINGGGSDMTEEDNGENIKEAFLCCTKLACNFLFNTYFKTSKSFRSDVDSWSITLETLISGTPESCSWFINLFADESGKNYLSLYLVECPDKINRETFANLLYLACSYQWKFEKSVDMLETLVSQLFTLLEKDVVQHMKNCAEYFSFFYKYSCMCRDSLTQLAEKQCFRRLLSFLLGPAQNNNSDRTIRRWTTLQAQEFNFLHSTIAMLIINSDNHSFHCQSGDVSGGAPVRNVLKLEEPMEMSSDIRELLYSEEGNRYLYECLYACIELPHISMTISDVILHSCWCNLEFSVQFMKQAQMFLSRAQVNDIKNPFSLLTDVLELQDPLQVERVKICIEGSPDHGIEGLFNAVQSLIHNDARRAYHCIKFLVATANKIPAVKEFLLLHCPKWQWAVDWLKRKMNEYSYWPSTSSNTTPQSDPQSFRRTVSAQNTLAEATKLLNEFESVESTKCETASSSMDTSSPIIEEVA